MNKTVIAIVATCVILCSALTGYASPKILMIVKDGSDAMDLMLTKEIGLMVSILKEAGFEPVVATESGRLLKGKSASLQPDLKLSDVSIMDYVGVMVPCMAYGIGTGIAPEGVALVKDAFDRGVPIAAEQGGVAFLQKAGILKGKHFAITRGYEFIAPEGIYEGNNVTIDGMVITAGICPYQATSTMPSNTEALTKQFISILKEARM
jgi:putative intracellular protease/amidase